MAGKYKQGIFKPQNKEKYKGNLSINPPIYRSSWELKCMLKFDKHPDILEWSSEGVIIPYKSPLDGKLHRYFVDFFVKYKDKEGNIRRKIIEVKPKAQRTSPVKGSKKEKTYLREVMTYGVNTAKWEAAQAMANKKGWEFEIWDETDIK